MSKTAAELMRSGLGLVLMGIALAAPGRDAFAQEGLIAPAAPEAAELAAPETAEEIPPPPPIAERMEALKSADLETLKAAQEECLKHARVLTEKIPELRRQIRETYEEARLNAPEALEIKRQIRELEAKLDRTLQDLPAVQEALQSIRQIEQDMLAELQFRTTLGGMIAAKEQAAPAAADVEAAE